MQNIFLPEYDNQMDIEKFKRDMKADIDAHRDEKARAEAAASTHAQVILKPFLDLAEAANVVLPGIAAVQPASINQYQYDIEIVVGSRTIQFACSASSNDITIYGMAEELQNIAPPKQPRNKLVSSIVLAIDDTTIDEDQREAAVSAFAQLIRNQAKVRPGP
jgi:hypothetical protein